MHTKKKIYWVGTQTQCGISTWPWNPSHMGCANYGIASIAPSNIVSALCTCLPIVLNVALSVRLVGQKNHIFYLSLRRLGAVKLYCML